MREKDCVFCEECVQTAASFEMEDLVKIEDGDYIFEVETTGALKSDDVIASAFDRLDDTLKNLGEALNNVDITNK